MTGETGTMMLPLPAADLKCIIRTRENPPVGLETTMGGADVAGAMSAPATQP